MSDANGNPIVGAAVIWSSSDQAVATVDAAGLVTAVAEGTSTVTATSGTASGSVTVTVILVPDPFVPAADEDVGGTMTVAELTIPAGVTITATSALVINATGPVQIDGAVMGDCVAVTVNGSASVVVTGVVDNDCTGDVGEDIPGLNIVGSGEMTFDGAVLTSAGDINLGNDGAALAAAGAVLAPSLDASSTALPDEPCTYRVFGAGISRNDGRDGGPSASMGGDGSRGGNITVRCTGGLKLLGTTFTAGDGGKGGDATNPIGSATGGGGGPGGNIIIASQSGTITVENNNTLTTGQGGKGGDAFSEGDPAEANGGAGGDGGLLTMSPTVGTGSGALENFRGDSGDGGTARANGEDGDDATSSTAATKGGRVWAVGGAAGIVHQPAIDPTAGAQGFTLTFSEPRGGNGGDALGLGGDGGKGSMDFPIGAMGPDMLVRGGAGGTVLSLSFGARPPGTPGNGGLARFVGGNGGMGWNACEDNFLLERGGNGGPGGVLDGGNGEAGLGGANGELSGTPGDLLVEDAGNGGDGGDGAPANSVGGAAGTNGLIPVDGTTATITDGLAKGEDEEPCEFGFNVAITVTSDPNGHEEFIQLTTVTMITAKLLPDGQIEFTSGSVLWIETTGAVGADGSFTTTGSGRAAGFNNTPVTFDGTIVLDAEGRVTGITGMLVYDSSNSVLPPQPDPPDGDGMRHPAEYSLTGTLKPPA